MFIGHFAVGFAGKKLAPSVPLPVLLFAAALADVLGSVLIALGVESARIVPGYTSYTPLAFDNIPWSHSLLMLVVWGAVAGYFLNRPVVRPIWMVVIGLVVSHWILDWVVHRPDMAVYPGGAEYGLALWNNVTATIMVELSLFAAGVAAYASTTSARDRVGLWAFAALGAALGGLFLLDFLLPPESISSLWISNLIGIGVLLAWAGWVDRHRTLTT